MSEDKKPKKRGRPRKNSETSNITKRKSEGDENIVLYLGLSDSDSDENRFTTNDTDTTVMKHHKVIDSISDSENDCEIDTESDKKIIPSILLEEIKKRDQMILNLKNKGSNNVFAKHNTVDYCCTFIANSETKKQFIPEKTSLDCWWCDYGFDWVPVYIPNSYSDGVYYVFGNFCSFNCAAKYNNIMLNDHRYHTRYALLLDLKRKIMSSSVDQESRIIFAPMRELLISKGGNMTIDEFRKGFLIVSIEKSLSMPPMIPLKHSIEEVNR
jgi:hypothetical protein